jgi:5,10-methylenetetrahydrofolate reductase
MLTPQSRLDTLFRSGIHNFVTVEINPPKDGDVHKLFSQIERLGSYETIKAIFFPDCSLGSFRMSALTAAYLSRDSFPKYEHVPHLTLRDGNRRQLYKTIVDTKAVGIKNILIVRGDNNGSSAARPIYDLKQVTDLIEMVNDMNHGKYPTNNGSYSDYEPADLCVISTADIEKTTIKQLNKKKAAGAGIFITQLFFDIKLFLEFRRTVENSIDTIIVPGIMPVTDIRQVDRLEKFGVSIPGKIKDYIQKGGEKEGIKLAKDMYSLLKEECKWIHIYSNAHGQLAGRIFD